MLNAIKIQGTKIINATATGSKFTKQNSINWSYLNIGKVAIIFMVIIYNKIEGIHLDYFL